MPITRRRGEQKTATTHMLSSVRLLRLVWTEARLLHHKGTLWLASGLAAWALLVRAQEPSALRGIAFFWPGVEAALFVVLGLLPVSWALARGPSAALWITRSSRRPAAQVLVSWGGITLYGTAVAATTAILSFTVCRIFGDSPGREALLLLAESVLFLAPAAALAPAVLGLGLSPVLVVLAWLGVLTASMTTSLPIPSSSLLILQEADLTMSSPSIQTVLASCLATVAGMLVSTSLVNKQLRS